MKHHTFYQHEKFSEQLRKDIINNKVTAALTHRCIQVSQGGGGKEEEKMPANITTMWLLLDLSSAANKDDKKVATNISSVVVKKHQIWPFLLLIISIVPC